MTTQCFETNHTLTTDDGQQFNVTVKHVTGITQEEANRIFARGVETGEWGWKSKIWHNLTGSQIEKVRAAARFFYGWGEGTESFGAEPVQNPDSIKRYWFKAYYAC
jgi:hypothetical protein